MSSPNFSLLASNKLPIGKASHVGVREASSFTLTFSLPFPYLLLVSPFFVFTERSVAATLQTAGFHCSVCRMSAIWAHFWFEVGRCIPFLRLHYFTVRGVKAETRAHGSSELRHLSWFIVTQRHPANTVSETCVTLPATFSRRHRPERCFNQKQL